MITDTFKWCSSRREGIPSFDSAYFSGLNLKTGSTTNIPLKCRSDGYLNISGAFYNVYGGGYNNISYGGLGLMCVALGTGNTPVTAADKELEAYVADFTFITSGVGTVNQSDAIGTYDEFIVSYRYTGASEVTISEVGIYMTVEIGTDFSYRNTYLMEHSLLPTPKVMNNGDTITLSVKLYHTGAIALS